MFDQFNDKVLTLSLSIQSDESKKLIKGLFALCIQFNSLISAIELLKPIFHCDSGERTESREDRKESQHQNNNKSSAEEKIANKIRSAVKESRID